ncbi:uncharacterized protein [Dysidea avara]|uniref:uncharacterized protein isoform X2 n=1 Tax=Dysidea avara TaxID=196820 RepID=UPI00332BDD63
MTAVAEKIKGVKLRQALGDVQYVPSFLIVSFLEGRKEIHQYEGVVTIRNAFVSGKLGKDFEECIIRRAKLKVAEDLAERLASDLAAALLMKQKEMEARGSETAVQRKEREQRESAKQLEEEKKRHQEEEEWEKEQAKEVQKARNIAADDVRKKRPEFVAELLSMDLETAPAKEILIVMKKLGLNPAGCLERGDLIAALKEGVPELKEKLLTTQTSSKLLTENLSNLDYDLLQSVADSATKTDLQEAELHDLRVLLSQAQLKVLDYPDRNSMIHALEQVKSVATMRKRSKAMCYGTVFQSDKFSADVEDIDNLKKKVKELQDKLNKYEKKPNYEKSLSTDPPPAN